THGQMGKRVLVVAGGLLAAFLLWNLIALFQPFAGDGAGEGQVDVTVPKGAEVGRIGELLADKEVVSSARNFGWRANWSGKSDQFQAGKYTMAEGMSYAAVIDLLVAGPNTGIVTVTVPEGRSRYEIAQQVKEQGLSGDYMEASKSSRSLNPKRYGAPPNVQSLEGFLFPATYEFEDGGSVDQLVNQQLRAFKNNIGEVNMRFARAKNLTVYDVLIIASLIDREVSVPSERSTVASVIYNRLKAGIALGIDATTRFETRNWTEPLTNAVLQDDSPYNTRTNKGLPPGPIGNPGLAAIEAAARPKSTDFLYYVANPCKPGTHTFAKTDAEFQAAVSRYNKAREAAGGKQPSGC
ncbi:MAG: endolytic transglycosylase MltG, partial [Solirubrobacterales bacterium]